MECPKCGAMNPDGAEYCNLCAKRLVEQPRSEIDSRLEETEAQAAANEAGGADKVWRGGIAGIAGGLVFLFSLGLMQAVGVTVLDFLFADLGVNTVNLSFFIFIIGLFCLISGGVGGNLEDKRDSVPVVRMMAALLGLTIWFGTIYGIKAADTSLIVWLMGGPAGIIAALVAFPIVAAFLGLSETFGEDMDLRRAGFGAAGGLAAGVVTALCAGLGMLAVPLFGAAVPAGFFPVAFFAFKLTVVTAAIGFVSGAVFWKLIDLAGPDERA